MVEHKNIPHLRFPEFEGEWEKKKMAEIAEINPSNKELPERFIYIDLESVENGELKRQNIVYKNQAPSRAQRVLENEDILFQMVRPYQKNNLYFDRLGDFVASTGYAQIRTKQNPMYVYQYLHLQTFVDKVIERCTGTSYPSINSSDLSNIFISLPTLPEQTRIASFLTAIDKKLTELKRKKTLLEQYKKGVMQKLFSQELRFKDDDGKEFPEWEKRKLSEIAKFRRGSFPQPYGLEKWYDDINGSPFIQVFDVDDNFKLKHTTKSKISDEAKPFSVFVAKGTIVLTLQGSIGRIAITQYDSYVDRTLLIFENYKVPINTYFFMYSVFLLFQIEKEKAPGGTIKTITKEVLSDFFIHLPDIDEQTKIAKFLSAIDEKINHTQIQIKQTELYKKGLLQQMFC